MFETGRASVFGLRHNLSRTLPALAVSLAALVSSPAMAATINVTANAPDVLNGSDGRCSLREAIYNINNSGASGTGTIGSGTITFADCVPSGVFGTNDTINIPAGRYTIAIPGAGETYNATGDYNIRKSVSIEGAGASKTIVSAGKLDRVFQISSSATVTFSGIAIQDGNSTGNGGGIYNSGTLNVSVSSITGNKCVNGGGIANSGSLAITNATISGNNAGVSGGGVESDNGPLSVVNSTISGNMAPNGGGIYNGTSSVTVTNSTITGNSATTGGGVNNQSNTIISFSNSIVGKQSSGGDCYTARASIVSNGYNIESSTSCGFNQTTDKRNTDPLLGPLANNGGPTMTHSLLPGSPAANAGSCTQATDQRGVSRPQGAGCDIGAFETTESGSSTSGPPSSTSGGTSAGGAGSTTPGTSTSPYINGASSTHSSSAGVSTVTITNSGSNTVLINSIGGAGFSLSGDNCTGRSIAPNGTCQVTVTPGSSVTAETTVTLLVYTDSQMAPVEISLRLAPSSSSAARTITLGSPADGAITDTTVTFDWAPAGTGAYHLYLCQNMDFSGCDAIAVSGAASANRVLFAGAGLIFAMGLVAPGGRRRILMAAFALTLASGAGLTACGSGGGSSGPSGTASGNVTYTASNLASGTWYWKVATSDQQSETRSFDILAHSNRH